MGQGDDRRATVQLQPFERFVRPLGCHLNPGKTRLCREGFARVDDRHRIVSHHQHLRQRLGDMHRADDEAAMRRCQHLDEDRAAGRFNGAVSAALPNLAHAVEGCLVKRKITLDLIAIEQQLPTRCEIRCEGHRAVIPRGRHDMVECAPIHSTRSTKIWILPPQASPTSQAWSLLTPKSKSRGLPSRITSRASLTTAPSTQPPETEPTIAPLSSTASLAPTGRGEEPQVVTTVANATPDPASRQRAACSRISAVSLMLPSPDLSAMSRPPFHAAPPARSAPRSSLRDFRDYAPGGTHRHVASSLSCREILARNPRSATEGLATPNDGTSGAAGPSRARARLPRRGRARP